MMTYGATPEYHPREQREGLPFDLLNLCILVMAANLVFQVPALASVKLSAASFIYR
jgi:hypothetical protein